MSRVTLILALVTLLPLAACSQQENRYGASGACCPTVAGGPSGQSFGSYQAARDAFTRQSKEGVVVATMKDASWLRYEGSPEQVMEKHKDYFEYVYTSFEVVLRPKEFTNPAKETFILEDSSGVRLAGSPVKYDAAMIPVEDRHQFTFDLAFNHRVSAGVTWVRLTRALDGETVEWTFDEKAAVKVSPGAGRRSR